MASPVKNNNIDFAKQQVSAVLANSSVVVKFICITLIVGYFLSFSESAVRFLTVVPGHVTPPNFWIWTYFTHPFIELHFWNLFVDLFIVVLYGKLLEPVWGALEMLIFFVVINVSVSMCTTFIYVFIYLATKNTVYLFHTYIYGMAGYVAGFAVAVKQIMPDHIVFNSPFGKFRNRHIPMTLLYLSILTRIIGGVDRPYPIMIAIGILVSWTYLRFYQKHNNGNRGDMADNFSFVSFFPETVQPFLAILVNTIFSALVKVRLCNKPPRKYNLASNATISVSLPGTDAADAERRRSLALKALNERLNEADTSTWPKLDESEEIPEVKIEAQTIETHKISPTLTESPSPESLQA